jgi:hypothetical protein
MVAVLYRIGGSSRNEKLRKERERGGGRRDQIRENNYFISGRWINSPGWIFLDPAIHVYAMPMPMAVSVCVDNRNYI